MSSVIRLRALTLADADTTWRWRNQESVMNDFSGHPFPVGPESEQAWMQQQLSTNFPNSSFGVERCDNGSLVGMTFLKNISFIHRSAEFAILIDENQSGRGYGTAACLETLSFAFRKLGLHRVYLKVRSDNEAAVKLYQRCGFSVEGTLRDDVYKNGHFYNQLFMAVLETEFKSV